MKNLSLDGQESKDIKIYEERIYEIYVTEVIPVDGDAGYWPWNRISINVQVDVPTPCDDVSPLIIEKLKSGEFEIESKRGIGVEIEKIFEKSNIIDIANLSGHLIKGRKIDDRKNGSTEPYPGHGGFIAHLQKQVKKACYIGNYILDDVLSSLIDGGGTHGCRLIK